MGLSEITILTVEDDAVVRRQIARLLEAEGYKVLQAATGDEAVAILTENEVNLILTDWKMPGMDGVGLLNYARAHYPDVVVAMVTAYPEGLDQFKPDAILVKPFNASQLKEMIKYLTEKQRT